MRENHRCRVYPRELSISIRRPRVLGLVACFLGLLAPPRGTAAQTSKDIASLKKQIDALQNGQTAIQKELEDIRKLLTPPEKLVPASLDLANDERLLGDNKTSKITLIEYFDYQCPYCAGFFEETMPHVLTEYVQTGKVKFIVRDFPLEGAHPRAFQAAQAAHCANDQGKFWPMHDALMGNSDALERPSLSVYAKDVGLDLPAFNNCVDSSKYASKIKDSESAGTKLGINGTPTFFLGLTDAAGQKVDHLQRFDGAIPYAQLKDAIDKLLADQKSEAAGSTRTAPSTASSH